MINKIDTSGRFTEKMRIQANKMKDILLQLIPDIQKIIREYNEQSQADKLNNLEKMDKSLSTYNLSKPSHNEMENLNKPVTSKELNQSSKKPSQ